MSATTEFKPELETLKEKVTKVVEKPKAVPAEILHLEHDKIAIHPDFNARDFNLPENQEHVQTLKASIAECGQQSDLEVYLEKGKVWLIDGESRLRAIRELIAEGSPIKTVSCRVKKGTTAADRCAKILTSNSGKHLNPVECMKVVKRLRDVYKWNDADILRKTGIPASRLRQVTAMVELPEPILDKVADGTITGAFALEVYNEAENGAEALRTLAEAETVAQEQGRTRVMPKDVQEARHRAENPIDTSENSKPERASRGSRTPDNKKQVGLNDKFKLVKQLVINAMRIEDNKTQLVSVVLTTEEYKDMVSYLGISSDDSTCKKGKVSNQ